MPGNNSKQSGENNNNPFMQAVACIRLDALVLIRTSSDDEIHLSLVVASNSLTWLSEVLGPKNY